MFWYAWKRQGLLVAIIAVAACYCNTSQAAFTSVANRAALAGTDFIDWGTAGAENTILSNPFTISSNGGLTATVSQAVGQAKRLDQGSGWGGTFTFGDALLYTQRDNGPMTIMFGTAVTAAGTQIESVFATSTSPFTGTIDALDVDGSTVLASFSYGSTHAVFTGISATGGDQFYGIRFNGLTPTSSPNSFAINRVDFTPAAVPVPAGMVLMLTGLPVLGFAGWTRRRTAQA